MLRRRSRREKTFKRLGLSLGRQYRSVRHQDRQGLLAHEIEAHAAEHSLVKPRMTEGAGNDEIGVLGVEAREQRLDRAEVAGVGPVGDMLALTPCAARWSTSSSADSRKPLGRDENANRVTFLACLSSGIASWTARIASRPPFQAMTMLSPTGPGVQPGGRISIGALDRERAIERAGRMTSEPGSFGAGRIMRSTQWLKRSLSPGFSAGAKTADGDGVPRRIGEHPGEPTGSIPLSCRPAAR